MPHLAQRLKRGFGIGSRDIQRDFIRKVNENKYSLQMGELDKDYFEANIQSDPPAERKPKIRSHRFIQQARQLLQSKLLASLNGLTQAKQLEYLSKLQQTIRSDLVMAVIPVATERDAFRIFETLNDRGLRLSVPDLLLNYLMKEAKDGDRPSIRAKWNDMLDKMGRRDIGKFLRHLWVSRYGDLKATDLFTTLKSHIEEHSIDSLRFASDCAEDCEKYVHLLDADPDALGEAAKPIRGIVKELGIQAAMPLLLSAYAHFDRGRLSDIARWLLVFAVRHSVFAALDAADMESMFFAIARDIRAKVKPGDAKSAQAYMNPLKATLEQASPEDERTLADAAGTILDPDQALYVIDRLTWYLQGKTRETAAGDVSLEHIFPKKPKLDEWPNADELEEWLWHIGNLTLLGKRMNADAANRGFEFKKARYAEATELKITKEIAKYDEWNSDAVFNRADELAKECVKVWSFKNPSYV